MREELISQLEKNITINEEVIASQAHEINKLKNENKLLLNQLNSIKEQDKINKDEFSNKCNLLEKELDTIRSQLN